MGIPAFAIRRASQRNRPCEARIASLEMVP